MPHLKIATINIPEVYLASIESLVNLGFYPSRSECIREALKQFLYHEPKIMEDLTHFHAIKQKQMDAILH